MDIKMEAEKYVSEIVKKIQCTGKKKQEIQKQLLADIVLRREAGESLEQIMESMGTAEEIAEAFGQNLTDADKKAYKRRKIILIITIIMLILLLLGAFVWWMMPKPADLSGHEKYSEENVTAEVEKIIELMDQGDYEALCSLSIDEVQKVMNQETIGGVKDRICADWGERQSIGKVYTAGVEQKGNLLIVTQVDAIYENVSVVYTISFDEDMKLAGIYMR